MKFQCPACETEWETKEEADNCCNFEPDEEEIEEVSQAVINDEYIDELKNGVSGDGE